MSIETFLILISLNMIIVYWLISFTILNSWKSFVLLFLMNLLRLGGSFILLFLLGVGETNTFIFFLVGTFIITLTEFYLLYRLTDSYLPPLIIIVTILITLQFSFIFINAVSFLQAYHSLTHTHHPIFMNLSLLSQPFFFLLLLFILNRINIKYKILTHLLKIKKKYTLYSVSCFFFFLFIFLVHLSASHSVDLFDYVYSLFILCMFLVSLYYFLHQIISSDEEAYQLQVQIKNIMYNEKQMNLANEFRHDYRSILLSLSESIEKNDFNLATEQLNNIVTYSQPLLKPNYYEQLINLKLPTIQAIITELMLACEELDISTSLLVKKKISSVGINSIDLSRCISILCSNALEAAVGTDPASIHIVVTTSDDSFIFSIENTSKNKVNMKEIVKRGSSTKNNHQGFGLHILTKILRQYKNTHFFLKNEGDKVTISFSVPLN